jgi:hypothetical protein
MAVNGSGSNQNNSVAPMYLKHTTEASQCSPWHGQQRSAAHSARAAAARPFPPRTAPREAGFLCLKESPLKLKPKCEVGSNCGRFKFKATRKPHPIGNGAEVHLSAWHAALELELHHLLAVQVQAPAGGGGGLRSHSHLAFSIPELVALETACHSGGL